MSNVVRRLILDKDPGKGINANPFEAEITLDITGPIGSLTGQYYSLMFELGRRGFATFKIDEMINVTPVFKQYYDLTIQQRQALEAQMKAGLGQIATAIHDYELIWHDLRKYKEYMDYFTKIAKGEKLLKSKKKEEKEQGEQMKKEGVQLLKSVFIDQVDAHTGEGIALRTITQRWPTIIVDFMRLDDSDVDQKKIATKYEYTEAEGAVLATKNKLFIEWRDKLFKPTLEERYQRILRLVEARRASIDKYTEMLKPIVARFKLINDALEGSRAFPIRGFFPAGAQAYSMDYTRIWAFLPFAPAEKYKVTREYLDEIPISDTGFSKVQIEEINAGRKKREEDPIKTVSALPVEPSIDEIVWEYLPQVEKFYNVKLTIADVFEARQRLVTLFSRKALEATGGTMKEKFGAGTYISPGVTWQFSPYFVFLDIPFPRTIIRLPNGTEIEDIMIENMTVQNRTQNVVIVTLLEIIAREKQLENYISQLLGEVGGKGADLKTIEDLAKEQYPEFYNVEEKNDKKKEKPKLSDINKGAKKIGNIIGDVLDVLGLKFDWLRARGPYEFAMDDRIAELFQMETMFQGYLFVLRYLQKGAGVPGVRV